MCLFYIPLDSSLFLSLSLFFTFTESFSRSLFVCLVVYILLSLLTLLLRLCVLSLFTFLSNMHFFTAILLGSGLVPFAVAQYSIADDYSGENFFKLMTFDTEDDPTHGYVNYVDSGTAWNDGLVSVNKGAVTIKSDSTNIASGRGRNSVRMTSTKQYTHGLVVLDLEHMPASACGIWPAFWMTGPVCFAPISKHAAVAKSCFIL